MAFTNKEQNNIKENLKYIINKIEPSFKPTKFNYGDFGIRLSKETFFSAYYANRARRNPTHKTINQIAEALSAYIKDDRVLEVDDFLLSNDLFIQRYSSDIISNDISSNIPYDLFENQLFRCYYLLPGVTTHARLGYFKIFTSNDGSRSAYLLRGINSNNDQIENIANQDSRTNALMKMIDGFESPKGIKDSFLYYKNTYNSKDDERIHLYSADNSHIHISKACIRIDFETVENALGYKSTMFWNIEPITKTNGIRTLISGLALMVDTNDGDRQMCTYKMGLDALGITTDKINGKSLLSTKPLYCNSSSLLNELSISSDKKVYVLDRVEDTLWYHYIQEDSQREITAKTYTEEDFYGMVESFARMKRDYDKQLFELKKIVSRLEKTDTKETTT